MWTRNSNTRSCSSGVRAVGEAFQSCLRKKNLGESEVRIVGRARLTVDDYLAGILSGDLAVLARAVTLIESSSDHHQRDAQELLRRLLPKLSAEGASSYRIGITGVPGAGKSTFIDYFGSYICSLGKRLAVLAIDPSSTLSRGSILGDKTRMERLSRNENCFIRPSPSGGTLGGVGRKTRETIFLCEAAGYDVIIVETVGVGQTEVTVRNMVDFFLLLGITGAGDELQTFKKGIVELADLIVVNKADGGNEIAARRLANEYRQVLRYLTPFSRSWKLDADVCSSVSGLGMENIWSTISHFYKEMTDNGEIFIRRRQQNLEWFDSMLLEQIKRAFFSKNGVREKLAKVRLAVESGEMPAAGAVLELMDDTLS